MATTQEIPDNSYLRALLSALEKAKKYQDVELIENLKKLAQPLDEDAKNNFHIVATYAQDEIRQEYEEYRINKKEDALEAQESLEKTAYGDFLEAEKSLYRDFIHPPSYYREEDLVSSAFDAKFFSEEDRRAWEQARKSLLEYAKNPDYEKYPEGLNDFREYLQKYYGQLIRIQVAGYAKSSDDGHTQQSGYSFRIHKIDDKLFVVGDANYADELKTIIEQSDNNKIPEEFADLKLMTVEDSLLFGYEL